MALTLLHQDNFNRSDRNLNGDTMSDGVGAWTVYNSGSFAIVSNQGKGSATGSPGIIIDSAMSDAGDQKAQIVTRDSDQGVICRWTSGTSDGTYYLAYRSGAGVIIYRAANVSFTNIGSSGGSGVANGDTLALEVIGSAITVYVNGSSIATATDSNYATGKCGEYGGFSADILFDDFADYVDAGGGGMLNRFAWLGGLGKPISSLTGGLHG